MRIGNSSQSITRVCVCVENNDDTISTDSRTFFFSFLIDVMIWSNFKGKIDWNFVWKKFKTNAWKCSNLNGFGAHSFSLYVTNIHFNVNVHSHCVLAIYTNNSNPLNRQTKRLLGCWHTDQKLMWEFLLFVAAYI